MADTKVSALTLLNVKPADDDYYTIVDTSDTTMSASGTNKRIRADRILHTSGTANVLNADLTITKGTPTLTLNHTSGYGNVAFGSTWNIRNDSGSDKLYIVNTGSGTPITVNNGNQVGINNTSPGFDFHILGNSTDSVSLALQNDSSGGTRYVFQSTGGSAAPGAGYLEITSLGQPASNRLSFEGANGRLGVGVSNPSYKLDVNGQAHASSFPTSSDVRLKTNIRRLNLTSQLKQKLNAINAYTFEWVDNYAGVDEFKREDGIKKDLQVGFIAQEVQSAVPQLVTNWRHIGKDGEVLEDALAVDYTRFVPILWEAVKELYAEVNQLKARLAVLGG